MKEIKFLSTRHTAQQGVNLSDAAFPIYTREDLIQLLADWLKVNISLKPAKSKHRKYLLFGFNTYFPSGGMNDLLVNSYDTLEDAEQACKLNILYDTIQIVDRDTWQIIKEC